jgi:hypothetical protein
MNIRELYGHEFLKLTINGGGKLQTGEILPTNFEFWGAVSALKFFRQFGAIYDSEQGGALISLGNGKFAELSKEELFDESKAEEIKKFVLALMKSKSKQQQDCKEVSNRK